MKIISSYKFRLISISVLIMAVICTVITFTAIKDIKETAIKVFVDNGSPVLELAQNSIDVEKFVHLAKKSEGYDPFSEDEEDDEDAIYYKEVWQSWHELKKAVRCKYLYSMVQVDGNDFKYVIDGSTSPDDEDNFSPIGTIEDISSYGRFPHECMKSRKLVASEIEDQEEWGSMITIYSPIIERGRAIGFVACDFPAEQLKKDIEKNTKKMLSISIIGIVIGLLAIFLLLISFFKKLSVVVKSMNEVASGDGDLTKRIPAGKDNELGTLAIACNNVIQKLDDVVISLKSSKDDLYESGENLTAAAEDTSSSISQVVSEIDEVKENIENQISSVSQTAGAVNEISENINSLNRMIEAQGSSVSQASAAVEQMMGNINTVSGSVAKMASSFTALKAMVENGVHKQEDVNMKIDTIQTESISLQEANAVISSIAEQTNLLAMNAAIEAAHAGEAGKGFSVVADEIRKLSETSSSQSKTIGEQLTRITANIEEMVDASHEAGAALAEVSSGIGGTDELVQGIKAAMEEQAEGSRQISEALHQMNDSTTEVRSSSYEMAQGSNTILTEIKNLEDTSTSMRTSMESLDGGIRKIGETGSVLGELSETMKASINEIGKQVDSFRV